MIELDCRIGGEKRYVLNGGSALMQVPPEITKCVVFICYRAADGVHLAGTGFYIGVPIEAIPGQSWLYIITAAHVIEEIQKRSTDSNVYLRLNFKDRPASFIATDLSNWMFHPTETAVDAAMLLSAPGSDDHVDYLGVPISMAATPELIEKEGIGVGDEVFMTGLFVNHFGRQNNLPILRAGNIALLEEEPVHTKRGATEAYLIEARSIGGLSGSPVFVHLGMTRFIEGSVKFASGRLPFYWLGLMKGHWDLDDLAQEFDKREAVNMGIGIVVPAFKILEIVNRPEVLEMQRKKSKQLQDRGLPKEDTRPQPEITEADF